MTTEPTTSREAVARIIDPWAGWLYFGCGRQAGHYLFEENGRSNMPYAQREWFNRWDGTLPPRSLNEFRAPAYLASFNRLGCCGMTAISWWDFSVDKRPGSNSTIFAPSLTITPGEMLDEAHRRFPWVFNRLPAPLVMMDPNP